MAQANPKAQLRQKIQARHEERLGKERERFTQGPTPGQARHQAHASANAEYSPTIRGIRGELASSRVQQKQSNQWYNQLGSEQAAAAQGEISNANQFSTSLTQQLQNANNTNAAYLASQQAAQAQNAALTGIPTQVGEGSAAAAGASVGAGNAVALNAPALGAAYNQADLTNRLGIASKERGHEVAGEQITARKAIRQDLQAAQKQKGQAYVGRLAEERESARKQELDKAAFALEGQEAQAKQAAEQQKIAQSEVQNQRAAATSRANSQRTAASSAASTAVSAESAGASVKNANVNAQEHGEEVRYKRNHNGQTPAEVAANKGGANGLTPHEIEEKKGEQKSATAAVQSWYRRYSAEGQAPKSSTEWDGLTQLIHEKDGVSYSTAAEAVKRFRVENATVGTGPGSTHR